MSLKEAIVPSTDFLQYVLCVLYQNARLFGVTVKVFRAWACYGDAGRLWGLGAFEDVGLGTCFGVQGLGFRGLGV